MYPPHHLGGYELACRDAVHRWRSHGHQVEVLTTDVRFPHSTGPEENGVRRALGFYWHDGSILSPGLAGRVRMERRNHAVLARTLDEVKPDVVSAWHMGAMSLGLLTQIRRRGLPLVLVVYDNWLVYGAKIDAWTRMFRRLPRVAGQAGKALRIPTTVSLSDDGITACFMSRWIRESAERWSPFDLPDRRAVVYGGIDQTIFTPRAAPKDFGWSLLCAGRVEERKGVHVAVEALAQLPPQATLEVVGSWDDEAYVSSLRRRAAELGLQERVSLRGQVDRTGLADALRSADIFLFPVTWKEPFGMAPLEAMACGTPVVGTGTGGSDEFLLDGVNCLRVAPGDAAGLAAAASRLGQDADLRERLAADGLRTAAHFGLDRYLDELEEWHLAAEQGFVQGEPPLRPPLHNVLGL